MKKQIRKSLLAQYRLILVGTRFPGNLGSVARLATNFDIRETAVVAPQCSWDGPEAWKFATGVARERLKGFELVPSLEAAIEDCKMAVGFTRRSGKERRLSLELGELAEVARDKGRVALVFGNEESGLSENELRHCTHVCAIPTADVMGSLNLSHAVAVVLSRLYSDLASSATAGKRHRSLASLSELEAMIAHWRELLIDIGLTRGGNPDWTLDRLRKALLRSQLSPIETRLIRGILSKTQVRLGTRVRGKRQGQPS